MSSSTVNNNTNTNNTNTIRIQRNILFVVLIVSFLYDQFYENKNYLNPYTATIAQNNNNNDIQQQHQGQVATVANTDDIDDIDNINIHLKTTTTEGQSSATTATASISTTSKNTPSTSTMIRTTTATNTTQYQKSSSSSSSSLQLLNGKRNRELIKRFIVVPEHRTLFCYIEKVGCTMFNDIFRVLRMLHLKPKVEDGNMYNTTQAQKHIQKEFWFQRQSTWFKNTPQHHNMSLQQIEDILIHRKDWTKAIFYRDPATRFLSYYRSKCEPPMEGSGKDCYGVFGVKKRTSNQKKLTKTPIIPFDQALDKVKANPSILLKNVHTIPMTEFCGGLSQSIQHYDMIEQITESTSPQTIERLLGMMDNVTSEIKQGIIECLVERKSCDYLRERLPEYNKYPVKPNSTQIGKGGSHYTGTNRGNTLKENYKTNDWLKNIQDVYQQDYDLFNITKLSLQGIHEAGV